MRAHRLAVTVPEDHHLQVDLPGDFPAGPAELIVLTELPQARNVVRLGGVLSPSDLPAVLDGDPISDALEGLRSERAELMEQRAQRYGRYDSSRS